MSLLHIKLEWASLNLLGTEENKKTSGRMPYNYASNPRAVGKQLVSGIIEKKIFNDSSKYFFRSFLEH